MKIKLEVSPMVASCLQRMIADEIENQARWYQNEVVNGIVNRISERRKRIIREMDILATDIDKQGIKKHYM
jgi:galactose-1-phosphate uridylyltransferase